MRRKPKAHHDGGEPLPTEVLTEAGLRSQIEEARRRITSGVRVGPGMTTEQLEALAQKLDGLDPRP
ncbi:MAG: hypothetical protein WD096_07160 [Actinomycetota bacterium]